MQLKLSSRIWTAVLLAASALITCSGCGSGTEPFLTDDANDELVQKASTFVDVPVTIRLGTLLAADPSRTYAITKTPQNGRLGTLAKDGKGDVTIDYTPATNYSGSDYFVCTAQSDLSKQSVQIRIEVLPPVEFSLDVQEGPAPLTVHALAVTAAGHELPAGTYRWQFGDLVREGSMETNTSQTFTQAGVYRVTLAVALAGMTQFVGCRHSADKAPGADAKVTQPTTSNSATPVSPPDSDSDTGMLSVSPSTDFSSSGPATGPFSPVSATYTLTNTGGTAINWAATKGQAWITFSASSGTLAARTSTTVTVSIGSGANALGQGSYSDTVTFTNATNGAGNTSRGVSLAVLGASQMASSVSQYGITWTFDHTYPVGQFVNGDWWVVGPVTVISVSPAPMVYNFGSLNNWGAKHIHGSQVDPKPGNDTSIGQGQALSENSDIYNPAVRATFPLLLSTGQSLLSSKSILPSDLTNGAYGMGYQGVDGEYVWRNGGTWYSTATKTAAVLTCLDTAPPSNSFRPAYCFGSKTIYSADNLNWAAFPNVSPLTNPPAVATVARMFERVWLDFTANAMNRRLHPADNMPNYGRDIAGAVGHGALLLCCNYSNEQKHDLLVGMVQAGIDMYGIALQNKHIWINNGGHEIGRKFLIQFAGKMLNNPAMLALNDYENQEDANCYYGTPIGQTLWTGWASSGHTYAANVLYRFSSGPGHDHESMNPNTWHTSPFPDGNMWPWNTYEGYRRLVSSVIIGEAMAARMLGIKGSWGNDAFFDYCDRWVYENDSVNRAAIAAAAGSSGWSTIDPGVPWTNPAVYSPHGGSGYSAWMLAMYQNNRAQC